MAVTLRERYGSAKDVAGQTANNKASLANKQAKQAAAMSNNSKMTQALLGAQAANDAVANGYDEGLDRGANMASQIAEEEAKEKDREESKRQFNESQALKEKELAQKKEENQKDRVWNTALSWGTSLMKRS